MAAKGQSFAEKLSRWGVTASNLKEHLEEMSHVAPDLEAMDKVISQARTLESQLEGIRGQAREVGAQLQAKFGPTSESLVKFGFRPRRTPSRTRTEEKPGPDSPGPVVTKPARQP